MNTEVMFSSKTDLWATPQDLFDKYNAIYHFETDVCALPENAKCKNYFTPEMDGLKQEWSGVCWCNPPYGREIGNGLRKQLNHLQRWLCFFLPELILSGFTIGCYHTVRLNGLRVD